MSTLIFNAYMEFDATNLVRACTKAEHVLAGQVAKDTESYVPSRTNSLTLRTRVDGNKIIYPGPYARFLYGGKLMVYPETGSPFAPKGGKKVLTDKDLVFSTAVHPQAQSHWFDASKAQNIGKWERVYAKAVKSAL